MLLPKVTLKMGPVDKVMLSGTGAVGGITAITKGAAIAATGGIGGVLLATGIVGGAAFKSWTGYKNKKIKHIMDLSQSLYFTNLDNNKGVLQSAVDQAEDEENKEALLAYFFLLTSPGLTQGFLTRRSKVGCRHVQGRHGLRGRRRAWEPRDEADAPADGERLSVKSIDEAKAILDTSGTTTISGTTAVTGGRRCGQPRAHAKLTRRRREPSRQRKGRRARRIRVATAARRRGAGWRGLPTCGTSTSAVTSRSGAG